MSEQVWVRPYEKDKDHQLLAAWLFAGRDKNRFDPTIFERGQAEIYVAFDLSGPLMFIPVVNGNVVESLALRPDLSPGLVARALQAWQHVFVHELRKRNIPDAYFVTYDETVLKFAQRGSWRPIVVPMLNLHVSDLEGENDGRS